MANGGARATAEPIVLTIRGRAKAGKRDDLLRLFEKHLAPRAEKNASQRLVIWAADAEDGDAFSLIEIYDDPGAAAANANAPWFAEYAAATTPLLDGMPAMTTATARWVKGVKL